MKNIYSMAQKTKEWIYQGDKNTKIVGAGMVIAGGLYAKLPQIIEKAVNLYDKYNGTEFSANIQSGEGIEVVFLYMGAMFAASGVTIWAGGHFTESEEEQNKLEKQLTN